MGVTVKFWAFSKRKNSTKVPSALPSYSYDCQIRTEATLTEPVIELNTGAATGMTYAQIGDFGRYYFIREWRFERGLWSAYLEVDVLATYKSQIGSQTMYVTRSASSYDGDIKDMIYPAKASVTTAHKTITGAPQTWGMESGSFVIGVLGTTTGASTVYYKMDITDFLTMVNSLFTTADGSVSWGDLVQGIKNSVMNPLQYVVSCRWYPLSWGNTLAVNKVTSLKAGLWECTGLANTYKLTGIAAPLGGTIDLPKHPLAATRGSYMNLAPFARYSIEWGGSYELDTTRIAKESAIGWSLFPDETSTEAFLIVYPGSTTLTQAMIATSIPFGVDIPLVQTSVDPGGVLAIPAQIASAAASLASGDIVGATSAVLSAAESAVGTVSATKAGSGLGASRTPKELKATFYDVVDDDLAEFGRPLMKAKQISTLSGYVRCQNDDVDISCLDPERDRIRSFMTGGFFYE